MRLVKDCICRQSRCIDHKTNDKITSNKTVDSLGLSACLSVLYIKFYQFRIYIFEDTCIVMSHIVAFKFLRRYF